MTSPVALKLAETFQNSNNFQPFPIDDAYLGICMQKARLTSGYGLQPYSNRNYSLLRI